MQVSLEADDDILARVDQERLGEDLRKLYVALTRARFATWVGTAPLADVHRSGLGYLLGGGAPLPAAALYEALDGLAAGCPSIAVLPAPQPSVERYRPAAASLQLAPEPPLPKGPREPWWIASYSALRAAGGDAYAGEALPSGPGEASGSSLPASPSSAAEDIYMDSLTAASVAAGAGSALGMRAGVGGAGLAAAHGIATAAGGKLHAFPRGAQPGSFLHGLLEWAGRQGFAQVWGELDARADLDDLIARRCNLGGWSQWVEPLRGWLSGWLGTPLDLHALSPGSKPVAPAQLKQVQVEMEFWFAAQRVDTRTLDALVCRHTLGGAPRPPLSPQQLNGMLKGYIDLVFEHEGRYYVADYKSNWLGPADSDYSAQAMREAVLQHRYELQYVLYVFALHRLLRVRLPDYDYERHIGGAVYLFLRGHAAPGAGPALRAPAEGADRGVGRAVPRDLPEPRGGHRMKAPTTVFLSPVPPTHAPLLAKLDDWARQGWLRELDCAFGGFLARQAPDADPLLILAAVLASHQLGRGHACLDLKAVLDDAGQALSLPPEDGGHAAAEGAPATPPSVLLAGVDMSRWSVALDHPRLVADGGDGAGDTPLVRVGSRLYLRRYWQYEQSVRAAIARRVASPTEAASPAVQAELSRALDVLFPRRDGEGVDWQKIACALAARQGFSVVTGGPGTGKTTTVVRLLALLQNLALCSGAGARRLRIRLAAPTGKAAARLNESIAGAVARLPLAELGDEAALRAAIPTEVTTVHRLLGSRPDTRRFRHDARHPLPLDLLVIDEASMLDLEMMAAVFAALPPHGRLILLGDKDQLASVEAGAVLGELCSRADAGHYRTDTARWLQAVTGERIDAALLDAEGTPLDQAVAKLRKSHRFSAASGIGRLAEAVNAGDPRIVQSVWDARFADLACLPPGDDAAFQQLVVDGAASAFPRGGKGRPGERGALPPPVGYRHYLEVMRSRRPPDDAAQDEFDAWAREVLSAYGRFQVLCALRHGPQGVEGLNLRIAGLLRSAALLETEQGGWYLGRPVLVTRNDYGLGLMNGDVGVTLALPHRLPGEERALSILRVAFDAGDGRGGIHWVLPSRLQAVETVFAMTVHKSQGSEFSHAALVLPERMSAVLTRELVYTGITRARDWFTLAPSAADPDVLRQAVQRRVERASGLSSTEAPWVSLSFDGQAG